MISEMACPEVFRICNSCSLHNKFLATSTMCMLRCQLLSTSLQTYGKKKKKSWRVKKTDGKTPGMKSDLSLIKNSKLLKVRYLLGNITVFDKPC